MAPVVKLSEAPEHPHLRARGVFVEKDGLAQPRPAPRFSRTHPSLTSPPSPNPARTRAALAAWGVADVDALIARRGGAGLMPGLTPALMSGVEGAR